MARKDEGNLVLSIFLGNRNLLIFAKLYHKNSVGNNEAFKN